MHYKEGFCDVIAESKREMDERKTDKELQKF
jgi:hypothetical protein